MPRRVPDRLKDLVECATRVFIAQGYRRAQMADVAAEMGVAKGTPYLYVESKEALFEAALLSAGGLLGESGELDLPLAARPAAALRDLLSRRLAAVAVPPALRAASDRAHAGDPRTEFEQIVRSLYRMAREYRTAMKLIDRCAVDRPELAETFYREGRLVQLAHLEHYLRRRIEGRELRAVPDPAVAARLVLETVVTWAVHIHWDPAPQPIDPDTAEATVVHFLVGGLVEE